ncbi:MAG TPA: hypothetical protein VLB67_03095 [Acidimicrobiia bacterium]|nr:hypothetical protein [Acidimicrobiia bacterium]
MTLSFLFALALAWSFGVTAERVDDVWSILRLASAVGLGVSLLRLVVMSISSRRVRRRHDAERGADNSEAAVTETNGHPSAEDQPTDGRGRTYEEVFGPNLDLDDLELGGGSLPLSPDDPERQDDGVSMTAEEPPTEERGPTSDGDSQERLRQMREQFKARAEEAALRVKQREAELQAVATSDTER